MIGKKKKAAIGFLGVAMTAALSLTMLPSTASAVEADPSLDNLVMNKTVQLEDDGTYTINLEAYAKGQVSTETVKRVIPADIVLVLDQSGSMEQSSIDGIPSDTYTEVTDSLTNGQVADGDYYYKVGDNYYPVTAERQTIGVETRWRGQDGNYYTEDQLSYSWSRKSDGMVYNTATPFVTSSLKTFTRDHSSFIGIQSFWYVNDIDENETSDSGISAARAREKFSDEYDTSSTTVEFHNDGNPGDDTSNDDPYYVAAVYTAVTREEVRTYQYTYSYTDENGQQVIIGTSEGSDSDPCTVSPLYTRDTTDGERLDALKYAADRFIDSIRSSAIANDVDHRVAVVGFGSDEYAGQRNEYYYSNTELFIGADQYNYASGGRESTYNQYGNLAADHYNEAFQSVNTTQGYQNLQASVNVLAGKGATYPSLGFEMANGIYAANDNSYTTSDGTTEERSRIVVFLTDGEPGDDGYNSTEAQNTINQVNTTKNNYGATVYTVAVLDDSPSDSRVDTFLKNTSSNDSYTLATSTEALDDFFQTVDDPGGFFSNCGAGFHLVMAAAVVGRSQTLLAGRLVETHNGSQQDGVGNAVSDVVFSAQRIAEGVYCGGSAGSDGQSAVVCGDLHPVFLRHSLGIIAGFLDIVEDQVQTFQGIQVAEGVGLVAGEAFDAVSQGVNAGGRRDLSRQILDHPGV